MSPAPRLSLLDLPMIKKNLMMQLKNPLRELLPLHSRLLLLPRKPRPLKISEPTWKKSIKPKLENNLMPFLRLSKRHPKKRKREQLKKPSLTLKRLDNKNSLFIKKLLSQLLRLSLMLKPSTTLSTPRPRKRLMKLSPRHKKESLD